MIKSTLACVTTINVEHAFNKWLYSYPSMYEFLIKRWRVSSNLCLLTFFFLLAGLLNAVFTIANSRRVCYVQRAPMIKHVYRARKRFFPICWHTYPLRVAAENKAIHSDSFTFASAKFRIPLQIHISFIYCFMKLAMHSMIEMCRRHIYDMQITEIWLKLKC